MFQQGQTALSIAQKLGYISVVETLKGVTDTPISPISSADEKYKVVAPETMQETFMSDSEDEGGIFEKQIYLYNIFLVSSSIYVNVGFFLFYYYSNVLPFVFCGSLNSNCFFSILLTPFDLIFYGI